VEILTDGASAIYGSDAVGGVVNFILRNDFEGVETRVRAGAADGVDELRVSQSLGSSWDSGNVVMALEYYDRDLLRASDRDFVPANALVGSLAPEDENYSAIITGRQELTGSLAVFVDALYSKRDSFNAGGRINFGENTFTENPQYQATVGVDWNVAGDWQLEISGSYADNKLEQTQNNVVANAQNPFLFDSRFKIEAGELKVDGTLFGLPGGNVRAALGGAYRSESYEELSKRPNGVVNFSGDADQSVKSAFAEVYVPIFGESNAVEGIRRLELSLAGRYDDYSTSGSSLDPQAGLMWEPVTGFRLRGRYGTSYKAPSLVDYNLATNAAIAGFVPLPGRGLTHLLQVTGTDVAGLSPQESESSSFGFDYTPQAAQGLTMSLNYYKIRYSGFITTPGTPAVLVGNPAVYGDLLFNDPSVDLVNQFIAIGRLGIQGFRALNPNFTPNTNFDPATIDIIVDARRRNLSSISSSGIDLATQYDWKVGANSFLVGISGTYALERELQVTRLADEADTVGTIFNVPNWRARASMSWQRGGWGANLFVNHTDSSQDTRVTTAPGLRDIDAYTTVDVRVAYNFSNRFNSGFLKGFMVALSATNALDEDPPSVAVTPNSFDPGFDPTNASPLGRLIALEFSKTW